MTNYWPFYTNLKDVIGNADLYDGLNADLTTDRSGRPLSAIRLTSGHYKVPNGFYFTGSDFTIMVWIYVRSYETWSRVIDFGVGQTNTVFFAITGDAVGRPTLQIYSDQNDFRVESTIQLGLNNWVHLAGVLNQPNGYIYINGVSYTNLRSSFVAAPSRVLRNSNFVGRSNW